jgi:hypothetical protein
MKDTAGANWQLREVRRLRHNGFQWGPTKIAADRFVDLSVNSREPSKQAANG